MQTYLTLFSSAKVLFLNTDELPALETNQDERVQNPTEANVVQIIAEALCASGVPEESIGVISVYRAQLKLLTAKLKSRPRIEVLTADRSQGRDKDCVIISLVRANDNNMIGDLLRDWRRLNVTFTRAKSKLIIVGSRKTLDSSTVVKAFLGLIDENGWAYALPPCADQLYTLPASCTEERATQAHFYKKSGGGATPPSKSQSWSSPGSCSTGSKRTVPSSPQTTPTRGQRRLKQKRVFKPGPGLSLRGGSSGLGGHVTRDIMAELGVSQKKGN